MNEVLHEELIPGGWHWSHVVKKGTALRLTDPEGGACAALVFFNPRDTSERYNLPDTLKAQFTAKLTKGHALYSDMGRVFLSILEDEVGWHDPLGGVIDDARLESHYGTKNYQQFRNAFTRSGQRALVTEMARHELGVRDLTTPINFFSKVVIDDGRLRWSGQETKGRTVVLQAELDVLVVLAATQHRLDPRTDWDPRPVKAELIRSAVPAEANPAWAQSDQNKRGFHNAALYAL
jgi:uncharacterized protein